MGAIFFGDAMPKPKKQSQKVEKKLTLLKTAAKKKKQQEESEVDDEIDPTVSNNRQMDKFLQKLYIAWNKFRELYNVRARSSLWRKDSTRPAKKATALGGVSRCELKRGVAERVVDRAFFRRQDAVRSTGGSAKCCRAACQDEEL